MNRLRRRYKLKISLATALLLLIAIRVSYVQYDKSQVNPSTPLHKMYVERESPQKESPTLVYLHGLFASHRYWESLNQRLQGQFSQLTMDLLGFGDSPKPRALYTVHEHVEAIHQVISSAVHRTRPLVLIGHSMGAFLALNYTIAHASQVKGLILINPPMLTSEEDLKQDLQKTVSPIFMTMTFDSRWAKLFCQLHELIPSILYPIIRLEEPQLPAAVARDVEKHSWESFSGSYRHVLLEQNFTALLRSAPTLPTLIIEGEDDVHRKEQILSTILELHSHVRVRWAAGGHNFPAEQPGDLVAILQTFANGL